MVAADLVATKLVGRDASKKKKNTEKKLKKRELRNIERRYRRRGERERVVVGSIKSTW